MNRAGGGEVGCCILCVRKEHIFRAIADMQANR